MRRRRSPLEHPTAERPALVPGKWTIILCIVGDSKQTIHPEVTCGGVRHPLLAFFRQILLADGAPYWR